MKRYSLACFLFASAAGLPIATAAADDAATHCSAFRNIERQTSAGLGRLIDPVTRLASIQLQCADQVLHFQQDLTIPDASLKRGWLDRQRAQWSAAYCKPGSVTAAAISAGWTVTTTITTSDGARYRFTAACQEEIARLEPLEAAGSPAT